jgi:lysozyme family protein
VASFAEYKDGYTADLAAMQIKPAWQGAIDRAAKYAIDNRWRYWAVQRRTGVPWQLLAAWHWRECNGDFRGCLHNGEHIIGNGRKTHLVPAGRGPFETWEDAAVDACEIKGLSAIKDWSDEMVCYQTERFNGFGYRHPGRPKSPYVWQGTTIYKGPGKFSSDGHYDPSLTDPQIGVVAEYMRIKEMVDEKGIRDGSTRVSILAKVKSAYKWAATTIAGLFTADQLGVLRSYYDQLSGVVTPGSIALLAGLGLGGWLLFRYLEDSTIAEGKAAAEEPGDGEPGVRV